MCLCVRRDTRTSRLLLSSAVYFLDCGERIVEKNQKQFRLSEADLQARRSFVKATRDELDAMKERLSLNRAVDSDRTARQVSPARPPPPPATACGPRCREEALEWVGLCCCLPVARISHERHERYSIDKSLNISGRRVFLTVREWIRGGSVCSYSDRVAGAPHTGAKASPSTYV